MNSKSILNLVILIFIVSSCSTSPFSYKNKNRYPGHYKIGRPYKIKNETYVPKADKSYSAIGMASWYGHGDGFHGKKTANGDRMSKHSLTAAHNTLPMPSMVRVTNLHNNKSAILMVNDRGPFSRKRIIDVSAKAAEALGFRRQGVAKVKVEYLHDHTMKLLNKLSLAPEHGKLPKNPMKDPRCNIDCYLKMVNNVHNAPIKHIPKRKRQPSPFDLAHIETGPKKYSKS